jgi:thioredoxin 2
MTAANDTSIVTCPNCGKRNRVRPVAAAVPYCGACGNPLPWMMDADSASFHAAVEESPLPVLVDFWAPWCGPCRIVEPALEQLSRELAGRLKIIRINSDLSPDLSQRFNILGIPTLILFERGQVRDRITGAQNVTALRRWLDSQLTSSRPG